ncbi:zincin-like metallopeptidase domain-containing protein [Erysipelothrix rhusiopathiae]|nr:zincin-like metallopeptidase domain-containing protein [Erysipelothrix rhusiopathiae]
MTEKSKTTYNARQEFAKRVQQSVLDALEDERIPWESPVTKNFMVPINAITNKQYHNVNEMFLTMNATLNGYNDPRWLTFKQAKEQNWYIKKGSKSVPIIFSSIVDRRTQKPVTKEMTEKMTQEELTELKANTYIKSRMYHVFNAEQVSGIPKLEAHQKIQPIYKQETTEKILNDLSKNLDVNINYQNVPNAYYNLVADDITTPTMDHYSSYEKYASTLLHEFVHATGHEKRLNRTMVGNMESKEYATEELVAELSATYLSAYIGIEKELSQYENHKAYCQSWYQRIKDNPDLLITALAHSAKAQSYIIEQGGIELIQPKPKLELNTDTLKATVQIEDYAVDVLGLTLVQEGNHKSFKEHDSCIVYPDNSFYRFSRHVGGSILDFVMHFEEVDLKTAIDRVKKYCLDNNLELQDGTIQGEGKQQVRKKAQLELPEPSDNNDKIIKYLTEERGLSLALVESLIDSKNLYQDKKANCVFVSYENGLATYGMKRGTYGDFKGDVKGSVASNGFILDNDATQTIFTEGIIDALSLMETLEDPDTYNYVSVNGVGKWHDVFTHYIDTFSKSQKDIDTFIIAFDNDEAGQIATEQMTDYLEVRYPLYKVEVLTSELKDFNKDLMDDKRIETLEPTLESFALREPQEPNPKYMSLTINNAHCLKTFIEDNQTKKIYTFPKGSQYNKYIFTVNAEQIMNMDVNRNTVTLQFNENESIAVTKGKRMDGVYKVLDEQYINAHELLSAYRQLDYEPESKQHVRLSKNDIKAFREAIEKNKEIMRTQIIKDTDMLLNGEGHYLVDRSLIVDLQKQAMDLNNDGIENAIKNIEDQMLERKNGLAMNNKALNLSNEKEPELEIS